MHFGEAELLQDVLRVIAGLALAACGWSRSVGLLVEAVDVLRLRHGDQLHGRQCANDLGRAPTVVDVQAHRGRAEDW